MEEDDVEKHLLGWKGKKLSENSEYKQRFRVPVKNFPQNPIRSDVLGSFQADVTYIAYNGKLRAVLGMIEISTRFVIARVASGSSLAMPECVELFKSMFLEAEKNGVPVKELQLDNGSEFQSLTRKFLTERGVKFYFTQPYIKTANGKIERWWRTIRAYIIRYKEERGENWIKAFPALVKFYNNKVHSSTKIAPINANDKDIQTDIYEKDTERAEPYLESMDEFKIGDSVRIPEELTDENIKGTYSTFQKKGANWSKKIYTIIGVEGFLFVLDGIKTKFPPRNLQKIKGEVIESGKKVYPERVRKKNKKVALELNEIDATVKPKEVEKLTEGRKTRSKSIIALPTLPKPVKITRSKAIKPKEVIVKEKPNKAIKSGDRDVISTIKDYRENKDGDLEYRCTWKGTKGELSRETWEPTESFIKDGKVSEVLPMYLIKNRVEAGLSELFGSEWKIEANETIKRKKLKVKLF